jgi:peptidoglycan hydrolase CwlO-like protein
MKKVLAAYIALIIGISAAIAGVLVAAKALAQTASGLGVAATTTATAASAASSTSSLQAQIDSNDQQIATLNQQIAQYQAEIQQAGANKKTLQQAINALDLQRTEVETQVTATQLQINATKLQIQQLGGEITDTQQTIATEQAGLGEELRLLEKAGGQSLLMQVLSSNDITQVWSEVNTTLQVQGAIQNKMQTLQAQQNSLTDSQIATTQKQVTLASQKQSLASQQQSLIATEQSKSQLLVETSAQESTYEKLLAEAEAELNSFSAFTQNAGGSKLLGNQTVCDAWGCYYNQRDALWGSIPLNGTRYNLASDGCLVTALAMVMTHYGYRDVTPVTINSNPNNFAAYYPAYLLATINVDGVSATRKAAAIDATLATGNPVIVGLNAYGGTHFVVLVSGSKGNYIMRDPYITDGKDISFSAHYSFRSIFGITKVQIS